MFIRNVDFVSTFEMALVAENERIFSIQENKENMLLNGMIENLKYMSMW